MSNPKRIPKQRSLKFAALSIIALMLGMSALALVPTASAAASILYFKDTAQTIDTTHDGKAMTLVGPGTNTNTVTITTGGITTAYWWGPQAAAATNAAGDWTLTIWTVVTPGVGLGTGASITANLVQYTGAGAYSAVTGATAIFTISQLSPEDTPTPHSMTLTAASLSIESGTRIGVEIVIANVGDLTASDCVIYYDNSANGYNSNLATPEHEPAYPVPNLSTLVLMGSGLVVGVGMVAAQKKNKKKK